MKTLSSIEIAHISGGFSLTNFVESCVTGAFIGGTIGIFGGGAVVHGACVGATVFGVINLIYQIAVSVDQSFYNNNNQYNQGNCYPGYYYAY